MFQRIKKNKNEDGVEKLEKVFEWVRLVYKKGLINGIKYIKIV